MDSVSIIKSSARELTVKYNLMQSTKIPPERSYFANLFNAYLVSCLSCCYTHLLRNKNIKLGFAYCDSVMMSAACWNVLLIFIACSVLFAAANRIDINRWGVGDTERFNVSKTTKINCDRIEFMFWPCYLNITTCFFDATLKIPRTNYEISNAMEHVLAVKYLSNENIMYLPINNAERLKNMKVLEAQHCNIQSIGQENFIGLNNLVDLNLAENRIQFIEIDTFYGAPKLRNLNFGKSKWPRIID